MIVASVPAFPLMSELVCQALAGSGNTLRSAMMMSLADHSS
jgi:hypothetical protein